jgi:hypothetical protein
MDQIEVHIIQMQLIEAMLREERNPDRIAAKFATAARAAIGSGSVQEMQEVVEEIEMVTDRSANRKKPLTEKQLRYLIDWEKAKQSGESLTDWLRQQNVNSSTFYAWRKKASDKGLLTLDDLQRQLLRIIG